MIWMSKMENIVMNLTGCERQIANTVINTILEEDRKANSLGESEWISVDERLPDTTLKRLIICDQDIGSGEVVNEEDGGMVQISAIVAVISRRCTGGEVKQFFDFDQTIDGVWAHNMSVTHWMPLPEPPKMKGGVDETAEGTAKRCFTPEEVRKMTREEVRANYTAIMNSMKEWN